MLHEHKEGTVLCSRGSASIVSSWSSSGHAYERLTYDPRSMTGNSGSHFSQPGSLPSSSFYNFINNFFITTSSFTFNSCSFSFIYCYRRL
mmetsp:Transcript_88471/g.173018  ORF Transcript_88471/g.173018 Transcript_88471/m.173018 type:complete len:90 (-) Transcript_88471:185-454(-)